MSSSIPHRGWILATIALIVAATAVVVWLRVRAELRRHEELVEQQQDLRQDPQPDRGSSQLGAIAEDLLQMKEADQLHRALPLGNAVDGQPMTPERQQELFEEAYRLNVVHAERLREHVATLGSWPTEPLVGAEASLAACILAVHHHQDVEFMAWARDQMQPHVAGKQINPDCYAQVFDRVLLAHDKPQQYGTQMRYDEIDGVYYWGIDTLEDPDGLLQRRAEIGLIDYATYLDQMRKIYRVPVTVESFPDEPDIPGLVRIEPTPPPPPRILQDGEQGLPEAPGGPQ